MHGRFMVTVSYPVPFVHFMPASVPAHKTHLLCFDGTYSYMDSAIRTVQNTPTQVRCMLRVLLRATSKQNIVYNVLYYQSLELGTLSIHSPLPPSYRVCGPQI